jgi:predicted phosphodiesterase
VRVAALYDIHGNAPALEAVLDELPSEDVDVVLVGGDVLPGPMPEETLGMLRGLPSARFVMGNGDRQTVAAYDSPPAAPSQPVTDPVERAASWAAGRLSTEGRDFLAAFEATVTLDIEGLGPTLFCHGSPRSDEEIITSITSNDRLRPMLSGVRESTVVCGHTHRQFEHRLDERMVLNAGAVGMPYEGDAAAFWLLLGPDASFRRTEYDVSRALSLFRGNGLPDLDELLRESLVEPADPDEVQRIFESRAA